MTEDMTYVETPMDEGGNGADNKKWIIVAVVLVVLCCCCVAVSGAGWWLWNNGDALFGLAAKFASSLI